jgi:hypothetical protein
MLRYVGDPRFGQAVTAMLDKNTRVSAAAIDAKKAAARVEAVCCRLTTAGNSDTIYLAAIDRDSSIYLADSGIYKVRQRSRARPTAARPAEPLALFTLEPVIQTCSRAALAR